MSEERKILIIAGPNGAGKTTFAREFLPNEANCPVFVNADLIALGLSPFQPEAAAIRAGRIMLEQIHAHVKRRKNFMTSFVAGLSRDSVTSTVSTSHWSITGFCTIIRERRLN